MILPLNLSASFSNRSLSLSGICMVKVVMTF
jgi:hypothetical protein